jgi:predicted nucleic acid-binding protein
MRTALDTNILSPVWSGAPAAAIVAQLSKCRAERALMVSAPVFVELSAVPGLNVRLVRKTLGEMAIAIDFDLGEDVWQLAATSFAGYAIGRRNSGGGSPKRLLVNFVIASHALLKADRLMTRDANRYGQDFFPPSDLSLGTTGPAESSKRTFVLDLRTTRYLLENLLVWVEGQHPSRASPGRTAEGGCPHIPQDLTPKTTHLTGSAATFPQSDALPSRGALAPLPPADRSSQCAA